MTALFRDRADAGRRLAAALAPYAGRRDAFVLGIPRGGVVVAAAVAAALKAPLDALVVRRMGLPGREELALGAAARGRVRVLNRDVIEFHHVPGGEVLRAAARADREVLALERALRGDAPFPYLRGLDAIVVDDGAATGAVLRAAIAAIRPMGPARIVAALPVASAEAHLALEHEAHEVACLAVPEGFSAVGAFYDDFGEVTDAEAREALREASHLRPTGLSTVFVP